jgi:hypothetical protein
MDTFQIIKMVSDYYGVPVSDILSPKRTWGVVSARAVAMYLARRVARIHYRTVAETFRRDPSTVVHDCGKLVRQLADDSDFAEQIQHLSRVVCDGEPVGRFERARYPLIRDAQDRRRLLEWLRRSEDRAVLDGDTAMISAMGRLRDRLKDVNGLARSSVGYGVSRCGGPVGGSV